MADFVFTYVRGTMWLPQDVDLNGEIGWSELPEQSRSQGEQPELAKTGSRGRRGQ